MTFDNLGPARLFYIIYWVVFLSLAVNESVLSEYVTELLPGTTRSDIENKLYRMQLAGWIQRISYSNKDYFCTCYPSDPFDYRFKKEARAQDSLRRKIHVTSALQKREKLPKYVKNRAIEVRGGA